MAKQIVLLLLCLSSAYSKSEMKMDETKDMASEMMSEPSLMESVKSKLKRYSVHPQPTPCPPLWPQYPQRMWDQPKIQYVQQPQYVHKPAVTVVKTHAPIHQPSYGWDYKQGWQKPSFAIQKPIYSYAPQYQKPMHQYVPTYHTNLIKPAVVVKPDCPPEHQHTGIVYAPQQQYHPQTQIVKVVKPTYHPAPVYHQPQPVYHQPAPVYYKPQQAYQYPASMHYPKVEICD